MVKMVDVILPQTPEQIFEDAMEELRNIHQNCNPAAFRGAAIRLLAILTKKPVSQIVRSPEIRKLFDEDHD